MTRSRMPIPPTPAPQLGPSTPQPSANNRTVYWIKLSAQQDSTFTVTNARSGLSKTYKKASRSD